MQKTLPLRLLPALFLTLFAGCAHQQRASAVEGLKHAADTFHQRARWKDYRSAADLVVPERRDAFLAAREELHDDKDLSITDYDLEELTLSEDRQSGRVVSRISWMRLPSLSEKAETVRSEFYLLNGEWLLGRQDRGPFADALGEEYAPPVPPSARAADAGT
jgi:hypothetical protein